MKLYTPPANWPRRKPPVVGQVLYRCSLAPEGYDLNRYQVTAVTQCTYTVCLQVCDMLYTARGARRCYKNARHPWLWPCAEYAVLDFLAYCVWKSNRLDWERTRIAESISLVAEDLGVAPDYHHRLMSGVPFEDVQEEVNP